MRCPPGLVFDDTYQRCEWPGNPFLNQRLGSLRDRKFDETKNSTKMKVKKLRVMTTIKHSNTTSSPSSSLSTTVSSKHQTKKPAEP
jgi:hypothetical protein